MVASSTVAHPVAPAAESEQPRGQGTVTAPAPPPARKIVLFADGTGNAFTTQESNVWRLYEALDRTRPDQICYYIKGVGTSGFRPFAVLDGVTGIGVPSNVRKLYRFLCWNWQPGDEIYIFGFSRGSFTARTLSALIASQGLMPAKIGQSPVSHAEMQRNAMAAWREYRRETVPWYKSLPTIWVTRWIRDIILALYHFAKGHRSYQEVRAAMGDRDKVGIEFLGLFDTVEAFGVPIEELRAAIDWAIWPISFRNRLLSGKVRRARHALSLDDERTSFHPIRFDHPEGCERIKEVWFAGVHSDVGGGYPDGTLSYVPLVWMAEQVEHDLRFQPGSLDHFKAYQSAIGPMHDSRSGAAIFYRYGPRPIGEDKKVDGGPPVVHLGVVERMLHGCDNYAPVMLPASARVLVGDEVMSLTKPETRSRMKSAYASAAKVQDARSAAAAEAFVEMPPPDGTIAAQVLDTVWWRRFAYFALLAAIGFLAAWPWVAVKVVERLKDPTDKVQVNGVSALDVIRRLDDGTGAALGPPASLAQGFLPSYVKPWLEIAVFYPFATTLVLLLAIIAWRANSFLRDRIQERARLAWDRPRRMVPDIGAASWLLKIGRFMRLNTSPLRKFFTDLVFPGIFLIAIFGIALVAVGRSYFNWRVGTGDICTIPKDASATLVGDQPVAAGSLFETSNICWRSGLWVEKGRKYRIWIDIRDAWFDRTIMSGVNGFRIQDRRHLLALPSRRWLSADWFQPIVRIGKEGSVELPLEAVNVMPADELPRPLDPTRPIIAHPKPNPATPKDKNEYPIRLEETDEFADAGSELRRNWREFGNFEPIPKDALPAAREIWRKQALANLMVADFTATASGELFLYVNDAVQISPWPLPFNLYYGNNSGSAQVTVQRMPPPPVK